MPIPFTDAEDVEQLGSAAFLHVEQPTAASAERFGALLLINARGEPLELAYNRIELMSSVLWRSADRERAAVRRLAVTLFHAANLKPAFLLCRANVVDPHLFGPGAQIEMAVPVGRVATIEEATGYTGVEAQETLETANAEGELLETHLFWTPSPPEGSAADLFHRLVRRGLLLEPFERAGKGLREIYGNPLGGIR